MNSAVHDPFTLLAELAERARRQAIGLPAVEEGKDHWSGIGFRLSGLACVAALGDVVEILHPPAMTGVPGVKPWMQGLANVRGRLLPVLDLAGFFSITPSGLRLRDKRVLVIDREDVFAGLIVDAVLGMQYFPTDTFNPDTGQVMEPVKPYLQGRYQRGGHPWYVLDIDALLNEPEFVDVAR